MIRAEHIAYCTSELKSMASDFDVPMVILCQLNRGAEDETPTLANLKESGAIEEDADVVIAIHHGVEIETEMITDSKTNKKTKVENKRQIDQLIVLKNRNGPRGTIDVKWTPAATRFEDLPTDPSF
jgi:replicative DNA helicase